MDGQGPAGSRRHFEGGVFFVNLAPLRDPALLLSTIAQCLDLGQRGELTLPAVLKDAFRHKQLLLVLDNFEHLIDAASGVSELLAAAPGLKALVTSRRPLHLHGEAEYPVPPLTLPEPTRSFSLDEGSRSLRQSNFSCSGHGM